MAPPCPSQVSSTLTTNSLTALLTVIFFTSCVFRATSGLGIRIYPIPFKLIFAGGLCGGSRSDTVCMCTFWLNVSVKSVCGWNCAGREGVCVNGRGGGWDICDGMGMVSE